MATIDSIDIQKEVRTSYLDYAMSVIVSRALPDLRDGLKPVQRRILYGMWRLNLKYSSKLAKSARIVGSIMGYYHPHGDAPIYEALVRMAQDFSLRYPLIIGQGNFGCFTKDTKVKLTDGRDLSFEDLVKEHREGKKNYTYTVNSLGLIAIAEIKNPRMTRKNAEIIKVVLDNDEEIKSTPNHLFMTRDGAYKEAKDLKSGDSLMPLYQRLSVKTDRLQREGYLLICQNKTGEWVPVHHLADNYNLTNGNYSKKAGRVRHHRNFNKLNNNPDNITRLQWGEHWQIHYQQAANQHKNPDYRKKIADGRRAFWSDPNNRERYAKRISQQNIANWKNPEYREKMRAFLSETNKEYIKNHPEKRLELSKRASRTLKRLWQNPVYRKLFNEKITAANKKRISNNTGKVKFLKICRGVFEKNKILNPELYKQWRNRVYSYGRATSWETGINKYYKGDNVLLLKELIKNHKVRKIEFLNQKEDVFDLTIDKSHNFALAAGVFVHNSIDGDSAAQLRYTEAKMSSISQELLEEIDKETVGWKDTFDGTRKEPEFLPARLPQLLLNGAQGIAVGMATNIPPHNLTEIADALMYLLAHPKAELDELLEFVKGPDFPTKGIIYDKEAIKVAYATGRGAVPMRARAQIKEEKNGKYIVISELPYQVNKADLITEIAELVRAGKIEGIQDVIDGSRQEGINIVVELKRGGQPEKILNQLYHHTRLQKNFNMLMIALVDGIEPRVVSLPDMLRAHLAHRQLIITRRTEFELKEAKARAHILEGLALALARIDEIIDLIKKSANKEAAKIGLQKNFTLSELQAEAILQMRLQTLAALESQAITKELEEKRILIAYLEGILASPQKINAMIKQELTDAKKRFGDTRNTEVVDRSLTQFRAVDLIPQERVLILLTKNGYLKRFSPKVLQSQGRGGVGVTGMALQENDIVYKSISGWTHDDLVFFSHDGKLFRIKVYDVPEKSRTAKGDGLYEFIESPAPIGEMSVLPAKEADRKDAFLVGMSKKGLIKKVVLSAFARIPKRGIKIMNVGAGDQCLTALVASSGSQMIGVSAQGQALRFPLGEIRAMGRQAAGVRGMRIKQGDELLALIQTANPDDKIVLITQKGYGKKVKVSSFSLHHRGTSGMKALTVTPRTGNVKVALRIPQDSQSVFINSTQGKTIKIDEKEIPLLGRTAQGVRLIRLKDGDEVASGLLL